MKELATAMAAKNSDRNFDNIAEKFQQNIYQTTKGRLRQIVLQRDLAELPELALPQIKPLRVIDIGAGQGQLALWLAQQGHHVHLTDVSADMLEMAKAASQQQGLQGQVQFSHIGLQEIPESDDGYPLVLCHAVLEWLVDPQAAIAKLWQLTSAGGVLSLMFYNVDAKRFSNIVYGNFNYVLRDLAYKKKVSLSPQNPLDPQQVLAWCLAQGFELQSKTGVRCFHDYLRDRSEQESEFDKLVEVELRFNRTEPYASLGRYQHLLLRKPSA